MMKARYSLLAFSTPVLRSPVSLSRGYPARPAAARIRTSRNPSPVASSRACAPSRVGLTEIASDADERTSGDGSFMAESKTGVIRSSGVAIMSRMREAAKTSSRSLLRTYSSISGSLDQFRLRAASMNALSYPQA